MSSQKAKTVSETKIKVNALKNITNYFKMSSIQCFLLELLWVTICWSHNIIDSNYCVNNRSGWPLGVVLTKIQRKLVFVLKKVKVAKRSETFSEIKQSGASIAVGRQVTTTAVKSTIIFDATLRRRYTQFST